MAPFARREPPPFRPAEVTSVEPVTPHLVRVVLAGPGLTGFRVEDPASSVRLLVPPPGGDELVMPEWNGNEFLLPDGTRPAVRTFTPLRADPDGATLDLEIVIHEGGVLSAWAEAAEPGRPVAVSGPGRGYAVDGDAGQFVVAGDESATPAITELLAVLPAAAAVRVLIEVARPDARRRLPDHPGATVEWLDLPSGAAPGDALITAVRATTIDPDARVWAAGEAAAVQRIRRHLFEERGLPRGRTSIRGYWKYSRAL